MFPNSILKIGNLGRKFNFNDLYQKSKGFRGDFKLNSFDIFEKFPSNGY